MRGQDFTVIKMRLQKRSGRRLKRMAECHGWTLSAVAARLVEEGLRRTEFAFVDFRDSAAGRQACIQGSSLAIWEVITLMRDYKNDMTAVARHLRWPEPKVQAAVNYARTYPDEIASALAENDSMTFESLSWRLPQAKEFVAPERAGKP
jgi:hypothetical protein